MRIAGLSTDPGMDGHNLRISKIVTLGDKLASKSMLQIRGVPEEQGWEAGWWRETIAVAP
jgi:hypothetical protein